MKPRIKSMIWNIRKQRNNQSGQKEKRIQKNKDSVSSLWDNFKMSNSRILGVPEGKEKMQKVGNLFEKNNERKLPQFGKGNRHASPGGTESPKQDGRKEAHSKTS